MSISSMWNQYFNHYQPRQTEITKIKLATLNDVRKNWTREISICIKPWKREWIQILKRSLNLRDCLSHFDWEKLIWQMSLFFPFTAISSVSHPTCSNGRSAEKKVVFRPIKMISHLSLCLPLAAISYKAHHRFRIKRNQLFGTTNNLLTYFEWANADEEVFICLLKEVSVIVARCMLSKRNISCC